MCRFIPQRGGVTVKTTMGEKIKDLRVERRMTTKQLAQATGISEAVLNGLENDNGRDVGYSRIIDLAKYFDVPTDFLLGFTESRITKNIELKALGLTDKAIEVLLAKRQDNELLSKLIEHREFANLINAIDLYVRQLAANSINTINNLAAVVQRGVENYSFGAGSHSEGYDEAIKYINETKVDEDEFLRYRITERFNQILRDLYTEHNAEEQEHIPPIIFETNAMSGYMVDILDKVKSGEVQFDSPEQAAMMLAERMGVEETDMDELTECLLVDDVRLPRTVSDVQSPNTQQQHI